MFWAYIVVAFVCIIVIIGIVVVCVDLHEGDE